MIRNRAKRRLKAVAEDVFPRLGRSGTDYVVIGRAGTIARPYGALVKDLEQAIAKLDRPPRRKDTLRGAGDARAGGAKAGDAGR